MAEKLKTQATFRLSECVQDDLKYLSELEGTSQAEIISVLVSSYRQWKQNKVGPLSLPEVIDLKLGYDLMGVVRIDGRPMTLDEQIQDLRRQAKNGNLKDDDGNVLTLEAFEEIAREWRKKA